MRRLISALLFILSANAFGQTFGDYELISVPNREIDRHIPIGSDQTQTPVNLQGLWWMDGNPLADKIVSFATVRFTDVKNSAGETIGHRTTLPVYDQGVWSWDDSDKGLLLYAIVYQVKLTYEGYFNADYTHGDVTPVIQPLPKGKRLEIPQSVIVNFTMTKVAPDEFSRDSILLGKKFQYRFRRIVDGRGNHLPAWDEFVDRMETKGPENSLLPICRLDSRGSFPTACAARKPVIASRRRSNLVESCPAMRLLRPASRPSQRQHWRRYQKPVIASRRRSNLVASARFAGLAKTF